MEQTTKNPIILTDYRARCCGTCRHNKQKFLDGGIVDCELGAEPRDIFSFCVGNYIPVF